MSCSLAAWPGGRVAVHRGSSCEHVPTRRKSVAQKYVWRIGCITVCLRFGRNCREDGSRVSPWVALSAASGFCARHLCQPPFLRNLALFLLAARASYRLDQYAIA